MSALLVGLALAFTCPAHATVDRVEDGTAVVFGAPGVRIIARRHVATGPFALTEGARLVARPDGRCALAPPDPELLARVRRRLADLARRVP